MRVFPRRPDEVRVTLQTAAPMIAAGPGHEIVLWNEGAEALLGFTESDVAGRRCFEVLGCPGATRRLCCGSLGGRRDPGVRLPTFEHEVSHKSGERISVSVTTLVAASEGGEPLRVHLLGELRRQREAEEVLRQLVSAASRVGAGVPARRVAGGSAAPPPCAVTPREREVIRLLAQGCSTDEIAAQLGVAPRTARNHIQNVLCKLQAHSRLQAVAYASAQGLL